MSVQITSRTEALIGRDIAGTYGIDTVLRIGSWVTCTASLLHGGSERFVVRVVRPSRKGDPAAFHAAMDRVLKIQHRAIAPTVAYAVAPWGVSVVTRAVGERSLRQRLDQQGVLTDAEAGWLVCEVAAALDALHSGHPPVVHRALCPENISLAADGSSVWTEACGLVHALAAGGWFDPCTEGYAEAGYRSPGDLTDPAEPPADVFVLASIAYECLTGVQAFPPLEKSRSGGFDRPPRPVREIRPTVAAEVDTALTRAWALGNIPGFETASAFAMEFARGLMADAARSTPATALSFSQQPPPRSGVRLAENKNDVTPARASHSVHGAAVLDAGIDRALDDLWDRRDTQDFGTPTPAPSPPASPASTVCSPPTPPPVARPARRTPTLRGSVLPVDQKDMETGTDPDGGVKIPLRAVLSAPTRTGPASQPLPTENIDTLAPPSRYNAWANQVSRPGSPVAPLPSADDPSRAAPMNIPPAPAMPSPTLATPSEVHGHAQAPADAVTAPLPKPSKSAPRIPSRRPVARSLARGTTLPVLNDRGAVILGGCIVLAATILAASQVYTYRLGHPPRREPTPTVLAPRSTPSTVTGRVAVPAAPMPAAVTPLQTVAPREAPPGTAQPAPAVPDHPSELDIAAARDRLVTAVRPCFGDPHPIRRVRVRVEYLGDTGRPAEATVRGHFARTSAASCIAAAAREVTVPMFSMDRWVWEYVFDAPE